MDNNKIYLTAHSYPGWLSWEFERWSAEWEVAGSNPGWTNTQGLSIAVNS